MSFNIVLQKNDSEKNAVDKKLTDIVTLTGTLKQSTSIIDPVIIVEQSLTTLTEANYMTISTFGRSYFIRDIISINNSLVEIHAHVDVLSSFKTSIRKNNAIIAAQQNNWNLYINDGTFHTYQNPIILTKAFPSGFSSQSYVMAVAGSAGSTQNQSN